MSHKEQFNKWKLNRESEGEKFFNQLSDVISNPEVNLKVGDKVMFTNDYDVTFGPHEVLAFQPHDRGRVVYIDTDSYWFPVRPDQLSLYNPQNSPMTTIKIIQVSETNLTKALGSNPDLWKVADPDLVRDYIDHLKSESKAFPYLKDEIRTLESALPNKPIFWLFSDEGLQTYYFAVEGQYILWEEPSPEGNTSGCYTVTDTLSECEEQVRIFEEECNNYNLECEVIKYL